MACLRAIVGIGSSLALLLLAGCSGGAGAPKAGANDIAGVVMGQHGAEAGVWVIAETRELPTHYAKVVVTDDQGRFLVPDLPSASYAVWARGYGIVDTAPSQARPGSVVRIEAKDATPVQAARIYPAGYWYSMLKIPPAEEFSGPGRNHDIPENITQAVWINSVKQGACTGCHQMGDAATRTIPKAFASGSSQDQWVRRLQSGQAALDMIERSSTLGTVLFRNFADWTDRIAAGELPKAKPERPQGVERNVVFTTWDWLDEKHYVHDAMATDERDPTVNANGPVYGATELSTDDIPILDPVRNTVSVFKAPVRDSDTPIAARPFIAGTAYWGDEHIWDSHANIHNQMMDNKGRLWMTASVRNPSHEPAFCRKGSADPSAKAAPLDSSDRQLSMLDPRTGKYTFIDTCFTDHHLQFDAKGVLWTSGGVSVVGWLDVPMFDQTGDAAQALGWTPLIVDTNGNGKRDAFTEPGQRPDPKKDTRVLGPWYGVMPSPDGSVWGSVWAAIFLPPFDLVRINPGSDPAHTALAEVYRIPEPGYGLRGAAVDGQGVVWAGLASGQLASFDRRKCKGPLNGPKAAEGNLCPEGWTLTRLPGPSFESGPDISVEAVYYTWVDRFNSLGLGKDVPILTGNELDAVHAYVDGKFITLRLPYPVGFYVKGMDGRIDDPNAGWKGRGVWTASGDRAPWHHEGGKGDKPFVVHIQMRPGPLAD
jgi:hypothetical protein